MEEKQLNEKESIELISRMIRNTQSKLEKGDGTYFLTWGYTTIAITLSVWLTMLYAPNYWWNLLWFAIPIIGWPLSILCTRKSKKEKGVTTYIDKIVGYIWLVLGTACFLSSAICIFSNPNVNILLMVILLMGSGCALTGLVIKFKALVVCGFISMALSFVTVFLPRNRYEFLFFIISFILMMVIPGHILNCKAKREAKNV